MIVQLFFLLHYKIVTILQKWNVMHELHRNAQLQHFNRPGKKRNLHQLCKSGFSRVSLIQHVCKILQRFGWCMQEYVVPKVNLHNPVQILRPFCARV